MSWFKFSYMFVLEKDKESKNMRGNTQYSDKSVTTLNGQHKRFHFISFKFKLDFKL